jgi:mycothiol synthase
MTALRELRPSDLEVILPVLLAEPQARRARPEQVQSFTGYLRETELVWLGWYRGELASPDTLCVVLLIPGQTAVVMIPPPTAVSGTEAEQVADTRAVLALLGPRQLHYAQALLEPGADAQSSLLRAAGFVSLAPLHYLERGVRYPWCEPPERAGVEWLTYTSARRADFAETVSQTYTGSADCPELTGLRPIEDVLIAHEASGRFVPALWGLLQVRGEHAGCVLLSQLAEGLVAEIVYLGVVPQCRGQGLGRLLVQWALTQARTHGSVQVTVVVDGRNTAARGLYDAFSFRPMARRTALLYRWQRAVV